MIDDWGLREVRVGLWVVLVRMTATVAILACLVGLVFGFLWLKTFHVWVLWTLFGVLVALACYWMLFNVGEDELKRQEREQAKKAAEYLADRVEHGEIDDGL